MGKAAELIQIQTLGFFGPPESACVCVCNAFLKYALQVKGQIGDVCLGQLG